MQFLFIFYKLYNKEITTFVFTNIYMTESTQIAEYDSVLHIWICGDNMLSSKLMDWLIDY